ncbi:S9 family peptidase [Enterococcus casseliflavus]|uniref:S9 family peptidase n=1 Tax=Enterococcus casseliflavus TaxID=37734 RepID=UPI001432DBDD|nr:S9 family peptidase [Enterococcus casseliflavus]MEB6086567.1 S9 family peptidase [Enterococcus casseliflavus]NKD37387.1 S9 family peptidase [Enterococcus casseliflavus]
MEKITNETLFELKTIAQPAVGQNQVFYLETAVNQETNTYDSAIYSIDPKTNERREWGTEATTHNNLKVSPDEQRLSFVTTDPKKGESTLWTMPVSGGKPQALVTEKGLGDYFWKQDATAVYYKLAQEEPVSENQDDTEKTDKQKEFPKVKATTKVNYLADGVGFLKEKKHSIVKKTITTQETELIFEHDSPFVFSGIADDQKTLFLTFDKEEEDEWDYGSKVCLLDSQTKKTESLENILPEGTYTFAAARNDQLLLLGNDLSYGFVTLDDLFLIDLKTKAVKNLSKELDVAFGNAIISDFQQKNRGVAITWLTDDTFLVPVTEHGKLQLYRATTQGEWTKLLDEKMDILDAAIYSEAKLAVAYASPTIPSRLALIDLTSGEVTDLYDPNQAVMSQLAISKPEAFWYEGADDWQIQGWYLPPTETQESHPAILYIHGGPQVCYGETFFHEMQVHAANGYGVILLNPRGGQGYGQAFVKSILGDYGNKDYQDLLLGVDAVVANHPEIDTNTIHVAGGSYGGFMTNWIVGHTDRFCAAVTQRSISNWISFYGTSDIGPAFVKFQLLRELDETEGLWKMSPLAYASQVKTPTLVLHGENDLRCPQEQGQQFYMALQRQGVDTKLMLFPQSSHGLSRNGLPNLRIERLQAISEWLASHENQSVN